MPKKIQQLEAVYGIIGKPVAHSLSPVMHNTAFKELKVNAVYKAFEVQEEDLELFFQDLREKDNPIFGINVTIPYKEAVLPLLDIINPFAEKVQAVNTVMITKNRTLHGFNTDGPGFLSHLMELGFNTKNKRLAIVGAGGTTRAILSVLCMINERPDSIKLYNRTVKNAQALVDDLGKRIDTSMVEVVSQVEDLNIELADCLINTSSVGMNPKDEPIIDPDMLHRNLFVYDVIYNPPKTRLLRHAEQKGAKISNGLGMLFYQGVLSLQHWAGMEIDPKVKTKMRRSLEEKAKEYES